MWYLLFPVKHICFYRTGFTSEAVPTSKLFITEEIKDWTFHRVKYLDPPSSVSVITHILTGHIGNLNELKLSGTNCAYEIQKVDQKKRAPLYLRFVFHVEVVQMELSKDAINQWSYIVLLINMWA